jgi:bacillithiol synthase
VRSECWPFNQIPHTSRLFADFLSNQPGIRQFYPRSPLLQEWIKDEASRVKYDSGRRAQVADILQRQNQQWGSFAEVTKNILRLRDGAHALVTGQQVGLFGGPLFSIYKALTAVKLAALATENGVDCVPVFWLATEDHDLEEVNHVFVPGPDASLQKIVSSAQRVLGAPVGEVRFDEEITATIESLAPLLGESEILSALRESYRPGETFGSSFARLFASLFGDWGVILLDARDPELHAIAEPIFQAAVERAAEIDDAILVRGKELEAAGYHQQVKVTPSSTLLFTLHEGARLPVHRRNDDNDHFVVGRDEVSLANLLGRIAASPRDFSANVLLRPVVQDYLLPTLAYAGGPAEVAYFAQGAVVYEKLLGRVTPVVPRFSATIVDSKLQSLLEKFQISFADILRGPETLREVLAMRLLPGELRSNFERALASLQSSMAAVRDSLSRVDKTLIDAADNAESKMRHQLESLQGRAARAELRQSEVLDRKTAFISNNLYPNKSLQEREIAGVYYLARHGMQLLRDVYESIRPDCLDHQVISV